MSIVDEIVANTGFSFKDCARVIASAPARYFVFQIPKVQGGLRTIAHPSKELKEIQRFIVERKLKDLPVHHCATAYRVGCNIKKNAESHLNAKFLLKLDFKDFFFSIKPSDFALYTSRRKYAEVPKSDVQSYLQILFWGKIKNSRMPHCLSIGAPSSPLLSNILMFGFDDFCYRWAEKNSINYTRYADDITLSSDNIKDLLKMETRIRSEVSKMKSPRLSINEDKRGVFGKGGRRSVTGLVITPQNEISIGRERKRKISSLVYHAAKGDLSIEDRAYLKGMLGFSIATEVVFVERLRQKYGDAVINEALSFYIKPDV